MISKAGKALLIVVFVLWLARFYRNYRATSGSKEIPPFKLGLPFLGCILEFSLSPKQFLIKLQKKYGNIFGFSLAGRKIVLLVDDHAISSYYRASEEVLNADAAFKSFGFRRLEIQRTVPDISKRLLQERMRENMIAFHGSFRKAIKNGLTKFKARRVEQSFFSTIEELVSAAMIYALLGEQINVEELRNKLVAVQIAKRRAIGRAIILPPLLMRKTWDWVDMKQREVLFYVAENLKNCLNALKHRALIGELDSVGANYLEYVVGFLHEEGLLSSMGAIQLADTLLTILNGAFTNPSVAAAQVLCFLEETRSVKSKLIQQVNQNGSENAESSVLLDSIIRETLRICSHPMGSMRQVQKLSGWCVEDSETGSHYRIPHGWFVGIPHNLKMNDPKTWNEPEKFLPERFLNSNPPSRYSYIPFSGGKHMCPGRDIGILSIKIVVTAFLETYPQYQLSKPLPPLRHVSGTIAKRTKPIKVQLY